MLNNWHKKEKPFTGFAGFGGGATGLSIAGNFPVNGSGTSGDPYISAQDAQNAGEQNGTYYFQVNGTARQMTFERGNKFSNGVNGWVKWDRAFVKTLPVGSIYNYGSYATCQYTDQGERRWSNGNTSSNTGASDMGRITYGFPNCQYAVVETMTYNCSGSQTPDDNQSWFDSQVKIDAIDNYVYGTSGFIANPSGYPWVIWNNSNSATSDGTNTNNTTGIILPKLGDETENANGDYTKTFANGDFSIVSFSELQTDCKLVAYSGDCGAEIITWNEYTLWAH